MVSLCLAAALMAAAVGGQSGERLTFKEQSVKPGNPFGQSSSLGPMPGREGYEATNVSLKMMISVMYRVSVRRIAGPQWIDTARFDVRAKAAKPSSIEELRMMFQNLISDEFKLHFHKESREGPVYALVVDEAGVKMKVNESTQIFDIPIHRPRLGELDGTRVPMEYLAMTLTQMLQREGRPVIDRTGLANNYDFKLEYAPEMGGAMKRPDLFHALKEQLGLKLEAQQGPVEYFVVDSAVKPVAK
ncbi:MAG TPA: TIGR03435 family protein [Bryobacteraceae bacterium]|jgi:uncharacterized protein (TIGR03435 family)